MSQMAPLDSRITEGGEERPEETKRIESIRQQKKGDRNERINKAIPEGMARLDRSHLNVDADRATLTVLELHHLVKGRVNVV